jgi:hypothetical protein
MTIDHNYAENVRNNYRRQGAKILADEIIRNLQRDAVISVNLNVRLIERLVEIIEATEENLEFRP